MIPKQTLFYSHLRAQLSEARRKFSYQVHTWLMHMILTWFLCRTRLMQRLFSLITVFTQRTEHFVSCCPAKLASLQSSHRQACFLCFFLSTSRFDFYVYYYCKSASLFKHLSVNDAITLHSKALCGHYADHRSILTLIWQLENFDCPRICYQRRTWHRIRLKKDCLKLKYGCNSQNLVLSYVTCWFFYHQNSLQLQTLVTSCMSLWKA